MPTKTPAFQYKTGLKINNKQSNFKHTLASSDTEIVVSKFTLTDVVRLGYGQFPKEFFIMMKPG